MTDLSTLRDIRLPVEPSLWPPAPGWWILTVVVIVLLVRLPNIKRTLHACISRRRILHECRRIDRQVKNTTDPVIITQALADLSQLMRRVAHARLRPPYHSTMTGDAWLSFLTQTSDGIDFRNAPGRFLVDAPYRSTTQPLTVDAPQLLLLARRWLKQHA